jgi:sugar/nucleoside kinase (ribokinase family)
VFLPNEAEACAIAGVPAGDAPGAARNLQAVSNGWVVVKLGERGCLAVGPGGAELSVPAPATTVADTTGAGDAFNAGLIHALSDEVPWPDALAAAARFASTLISRPSSDRHRVTVLGGPERE